MMKAIFAGPDPDGIVAALEAEGIEVTPVGTVATRPALEEAGIHEADLFVLTDLDQATAIPIARDLNQDVRIVVYAGDSLPAWVGGSEVLRIDPALLAPEAVAEELADGA